jgi:hypothetical protein
MKKMSNILIITMILLFFSGCGETSDAAFFSKLDSNGNYTGFSNLSENYTAEQAEKDGCYVRVNLKTVGGEQFWKDFVKDASNKKNADIRIVTILEGGTYFLDVFYDDGYYRAFDSDSEDLHDYKFKYLMTLEGTLPNAAKSGKVTVLTDDKELTYKDVMWKFLSSDMNYIKSISPFKLIFID